jgi:hypothetical protein
MREKALERAHSALGLDLKQNRFDSVSIDPSSAVEEDAQNIEVAAACPSTEVGLNLTRCSEGSCQGGQD